MDTLTSIANTTGTDKGTIPKQGHAYTAIYDIILGARQLEPLQILEVGLAVGGPELVNGAVDRVITSAPSLDLWRSYFPNCHVYGVDISDFSLFQDDRFTFFRADCGSESDLAAVAAKELQLDVIIDDGSHASYHQQLTLCFLFSLLKPGGLYIIEDLNWQPRSYEVNLPHVTRTDRLLASIQETGRPPTDGAISRQKWEAVVGKIRNILLFDEDELWRLRRFHNLRNGLLPEMPSYIDASRRDRFLKKGMVRRLMEDGLRLMRGLSGDVSSRSKARLKLAIIQKD